MNLIYLQCDIRFNKWLLKKIDDRCVIEHTIERCKKLDNGTCRIVAGVYDCPENKPMIETLVRGGIDVRVTNEKDVTARFMDILVREHGEYVVRVGGDQCLIDFEKTSDILYELKKEENEWYYEAHSNCILPDIISLDCLKKHESKIRESGKRYFEILEKEEDVDRYVPKYPILVMFNFRANSNEGLRVCRHVIKNHLNVYNLSRKTAFELISSPYLTKTGIMGSWIVPAETGDFFYDENKEVNPWMAKSAIDLVKKHLNKSLRVFEWGCGNSTLFWSQYVKEVVSIEHDKKWYRRMLDIVPDNVRLKYCELKYGGIYCKAILDEKDKFDIVLVDGRDRGRCMVNAVGFLKDNGVLILDDSNEERYTKGDIFMINCGFKKLELSGVLYGSPYNEGFTSVYYRDYNIFDL